MRVVCWLLLAAVNVAAFTYDPSIGTNCIKYGGGSAPTKISCKGCIAERGLQCIWDMRNNVSGNVHPDCPMNSIRYKPVQACCPVMHGRSVTAGTGAYPDALACLSGHKCSQFYNDLLDECVEQCGDRNLCTGRQKSAARSTRAMPLMSIASLVLSIAVGVLSVG